MPPPHHLQPHRRRSISATGNRTEWRYDGGGVRYRLLDAAEEARADEARAVPSHNYEVYDTAGIFETVHVRR